MKNYAAIRAIDSQQGQYHWPDRNCVQLAKALCRELGTQEPRCDDILGRTELGAVKFAMKTYGGLGYAYLERLKEVGWKEILGRGRAGDIGLIGGLVTPFNPDGEKPGMEILTVYASGAYYGWSHQGLVPVDGVIQKVLRID